MAVRVNAAADKATRDGDVPVATSVTGFCFVRLVGDTNNYAAFMALQVNDSSDIQVLGTEVDGTTLAIFDGFSIVLTNGSMTIGDWYAVGYSSDGTTLRLYKKNVTTGAASSMTTTAARSSTAVMNQIDIGGDVFGEVPNADFEAPRWFRQAFTTIAEFDAEAASFTPVSGLTRDSAFAWADNTAASMQNDTTGNGRNLTRGAGSWTTESSPPIGGEPVTGTSAVTLANATGSATGSSVVGSSAVALDNASSSAAGAVGAAGSSAVTLGNASSSASGAVGASGSAAATLGHASSSATGTHYPQITGTSAVTLGNATSIASGFFGAEQPESERTTVVVLNDRTKVAAYGHTRVNPQGSTHVVAYDQPG